MLRVQGLSAEAYGQISQASCAGQQLLEAGDKPTAEDPEMLAGCPPLRRALGKSRQFGFLDCCSCPLF
jgi:hypothetical protein